MAQTYEHINQEIKELHQGLETLSKQMFLFRNRFWCMIFLRWYNIRLILSFL